MHSSGNVDQFLCLCREARLWASHKDDASFGHMHPHPYQHLHSIQKTSQLNYFISLSLHNPSLMPRPQFDWPLQASEASPRIWTCDTPDPFLLRGLGLGMRLSLSALGLHSAPQLFAPRMSYRWGAANQIVEQHLLE